MKYSSDMKATPKEFVTVTLPTGMIISGTQEQVVETLNALGHKPDTYIPGTYMSSSKGLIPIASMATPHIKNALLVEYRDWLDTLRTVDITVMVSELRQGAGASRPVIVALAQELVDRSAKGIL